MVDQHTVRAYDKDLDLLERRIAEMGGIAEKMVIEAMDALAAADTTLAHQVVSTDPRLDLLQREVEEQAILTIARRQPVAIDLREIIGAIELPAISSGWVTWPRTLPSARSRWGSNPEFPAPSSASST